MASLIAFKLSFCPMLLLLLCFFMALRLPLAAGQTMNADFGRQLWSVNMGPGLNYVMSIALDSSLSYMYVVDAVNQQVIGGLSRIRKLNYNTGADVSAAFHSNNQLKLDTMATAVAVDPQTNDVYATTGYTVYRLSSNGTLLMTFPNYFSLINSMTVDRYGNLIVSDNQIGIYPINRLVVSNFTSSGQLTNQTRAVPLSTSYGLLQTAAFDSRGNLYYTGVQVLTQGADNTTQSQLGVGVVSVGSSSLMNLSISGYWANSLWVSADDVLYVSWAPVGFFFGPNFQSLTGFILSYDTTTWNVTGNFSTTPNTYPAAVSGDNKGTLIYFDATVTQLVKMQIATRTVQSTISNGVLPTVFAVDTSGRIYVLDGATGAVLRLDSTGKSMKYIPAVYNGSVVLRLAAVDAAGTMLVGVQYDDLMLRCYNVSSGALLRTIPISSPPYNYVGSVAVDSMLNIYYSQTFITWASQVGVNTTSTVVQVINQFGVPLYNITSPDWTNSVSIAIDTHDQLYVGASQTSVYTVSRYSQNGTVVQQWQTNAYLPDSKGYLYGLNLYEATPCCSLLGWSVVAYTPDLNQSVTLPLGSWAQSYVSGIAVDSAGDYYLTDINSHTLTKYRGLSSTAAPLPPPPTSSSSSSSSTGFPSSSRAPVTSTSVWVWLVVAVAAVAGVLVYDV